MKFGPSYYTGRASLLWIVAAALFGFFSCVSAAQNPAATRNHLNPAPVGRFPSPLGTQPLSQAPLRRVSAQAFDDWKKRTAYAAANNTPMPAPPSVLLQYRDLTTNPRPPLVGPSTLSIERHPFWSWDQQHIYFASNNVDSDAAYGTKQPPGNAPYHIYRMTSDGSFVQRVTGTAFQDEASGNQLYPALNLSQTKLAYTHRPVGAESHQVFVYDLISRQRVQLTGIPVSGHTLNQQLVDVQRPTWAPGDALIVFAARNRNVPGDPLNIYVVDVVTRVVRQLTFSPPAADPGAGLPEEATRVNCKDPFVHPNAGANVIVFAANTGAPGQVGVVNPATGQLSYQVNPLRNHRGNGVVDPDYNLFAISLDGAAAGRPIRQLTFDISDDVEPAVNRSVYVGGGSGPFNNYIAFSSLGRNGGSTYDIYYFNGSPVTGGNPAIRLFSPDSDANGNALHQTDERYPAWSSGLPPQNPMDRIAFSSNRQNNVANIEQPTVSLTDRDIWVSEALDITPPTLFPFDEKLGEVLHITNQKIEDGPGHRIGLPGDTFYFYAKVKDGQYGVDSVWVQIKDPDGASTDAQGQNRKLFSNHQPFVVRRQNDGAQSGAPTHWLWNSFETDSSGVHAENYDIYNSGPQFDAAIGLMGRYASYIPGYDDAFVWSGYLSPPPRDAGGMCWLELKDDGTGNDLVAGDGIYSGEWRTPTVPSDYYVDLIAYDKAFNPYNPTERSNWVMYDNIWGFSTQRFVGKHPVLLVDDYGAGQKWPRGLKGSFRPFPTYRLGTEADIMDRDPTTLPQWSFPAAATGQPVTDAATGEAPYPFLIGDSVGFSYYLPAPSRAGTVQAYRADVWRILAKGPLPQDVLNNYTPTVEQQPADNTGDVLVDRPVPTRAIVWNAPYTGDVFSGAGTILDQATQNMLREYRDRAGRLVVAGGDILWALTAGGAITNHPFVQTVLGANFLGDNTPNNSAHDFSGGSLPTIITQDVFGNFAPLPNPPFWWGPEFDPDPLGAASYWPDTPPPSANTNVGNNRQRGASADGTPFQNQDGVSARAGWDQVYNNRMIVNHDSGTGSKTVFMSFSLASLGRRYLAQNDTSPLHTLNYRGKISHAMFCWMFSVELQGQVRNLNGNAPIAGAFVELLAGGNVVGSALTRPDGTYTVRGLPVGGWSLRVTNPGFQAFNKATGNQGHGLSLQTEDVYMIPAAPGSITGQVLDQDGQPVPNVDVLAELQASNLYTGQRLFTARTGLDGTYRIPSAPVGDYKVDVVQPLPTGFQNPTKNFAEPVTVQSQEDVTGIDFSVEGLPGPLRVEVYTQNAQGGRGVPIPDAEITLLDKDGSVLDNLTGVTDASGVYDVADVPAGPITVTAWKLGYQEGSKVVPIPQQNQVEILLAPGNQQPLYGLAVRKLDGQPLTARDLGTDGVTLKLVRRVSRLPVGVDMPVFAPPVDMPENHNYTGIAYEGVYSVALSDHPRYQDASVDVVVPSDTYAVVPVLELEGKDGILSGIVRENGSGDAIEGAQIEVVAQTGTVGAVVATATTAADGTWQTAQAIPSGIYTVHAKRWGYADGSKPDVFVAGDTDAGEILLDRGARGQLYGLVRRAIDNQPRDNVKLEFWTTPAASIGVQKITEIVTDGAVTTGPDGGPQNYQIGDVIAAAEYLPEGAYEVRVTGDPRFATFTGRVTVVGGVATRYDVTLTPLPGTLAGFVYEDDGFGNPGPAVENASVRISGPTTVVATTDRQGRYQTTGPIPAGPYTITASKFGYVDGTVLAFVEGHVTAPVILLRRQPPGTIRGNVRSRVGNQELIADARVELVDAATSAVVMTTTSQANATGNPPSNYQLASVPAGNYRLRATKDGWLPAEVGPFALNPGATLNGINLLLSPSHTFGQGLMMISLPDDYSGQDAADVLGIPSASLRAAVYKTEERQYAVYPQAPADRFRQGRAMFVRFPRPTAFHKVGLPAANAPFYLPVKAGWNMIGSVRKQRIEWLRVGVVAGDGTQYTMQEAMDAGIIQNGLYSYVDGYFRVDFLEPYVGYFMRARQDCTLIIPVNNAAVSLTPDERAKVAAMPAPSIHEVAAELAASGLGPAQPLVRVQNEQKQNEPRWQLFGWPKGLPSLWNSAAELWPWKPGLG